MAAFSNTYSRPSTTSVILEGVATIRANGIVALKRLRRAPPTRV